MDSCLGHIWENTKWIEMKLGTYMTVRGSTAYKNDNPTLYIIELSPITIFFHNGCLSWPYLGQY